MKYYKTNNKIYSSFKDAAESQRGKVGFPIERIEIKFKRYEKQNL